jgi:MFS superfamily sulfate permease-like transporter
MIQPPYNNMVKTVLTTLIAGFITAAVFGVGLAAIQYREVAAAFAPEQAQAEFEARIARELFRSPLLLMMQIGVSTGILAWQVHQQRLTPRYGAVCGGIVGFVQILVAGIMQTQPPLLLVAFLLHVSAGTIAAKSLQDFCSCL